MGEALCGQVVYEVGKTVYEIPCEGIIGDTVKIAQEHDQLSLCEVQVWGLLHKQQGLFTCIIDIILQTTV